MEETENATQHSDSLEATAPPNSPSSEDETVDITFTDDGWRGWAAAFGAKGDGVASVNDSESVWLALAPALFVAGEDAKGEAKRKIRRVHDLVLSETLGLERTPEFRDEEGWAARNPTSHAILLLRVLDVFEHTPAMWWERDLVLNVLKAISVDFIGLDLDALGVSANSVRDAMMAVISSRIEMTLR